MFLQHADYMVNIIIVPALHYFTFYYYSPYTIFVKCGSPTALAEPSIEATLRNAACTHGLYIPAGAFWAAEDIKKMADRNTLTVC